MALKQIKPALQFSEGRSKPWSGASVVNAFSEKGQGDQAQDFALMAIPGLDVFSTISSAPVRGTHVMLGVLYAVVGAALYRIDGSGGSTSLGTIIGSGPVRMVDNGSQIAICAAPYGYVYEGVPLIPASLPLVSDVAFIDGYFVWSILNSDQCIYSGINDGLNYDALDVFTAEGSPDGLVGLINDHRELQLYGTNTIEIWYNSGGSDNVFERQGNAFIERGCFSRDSIAKIDNSVHFYGDDRIVYRLDGYTPTRISTHAIEYQLRNCLTAVGFVYTQEGHKFYVLTTDVGTFAYDMATGAWHERRSWQRDNYRVNSAVALNGITYMGDAYTGRIYIPNLETYTEAGDPISVEISLPTIQYGRDLVTMYAFEVYCETGVGLNSGQGADPQIMMRYSDNGARSWSNELWRSMGVIGAYRTRAIWRRLGQFRNRNIKLTITDPVRRFVMGYFADIR